MNNYLPISTLAGAFFVLRGVVYSKNSTNYLKKRMDKMTHRVGQIVLGGGTK
jgi:hypothetical protein